MAALPEGRTVTSWKARYVRVSTGLNLNERRGGGAIADLGLSECARKAHAFGGDGQHSLANVGDGEQDVGTDAGRPPGFPDRRLHVCQ